MYWVFIDYPQYEATWEREIFWIVFYNSPVRIALITSDLEMDLSIIR